MAKIKVEKIELNLQGLNELMRSPEIGQSVIRAASYVESIAKRSSGKVYHRSKFRKLNWLGVASVYPADADAAQNELETNTLLKAVGHAGLPTKKGG